MKSDNDANNELEPKTIDSSETPVTEDNLAKPPISNKKKELLRTLKYTLFAASAGIIQIGSFTLFNEVFGWTSYWPTYLLSLTLSVLWNFTFNRKYTFQSANNVPTAMFKVFLYYLVFTPLSTWWGAALADIGWNEYAILIPTILVNFVTEFLYCRFFVFRGSLDSKPTGDKDVNIK